MSSKSRIEKIEQAAQERAVVAPPGMSDGERLERIKELSLSIARVAKAQGLTAQDDPRLIMPLAIAEVLHEQP